MRTEREEDSFNKFRARHDEGSGIALKSGFAASRPSLTVSREDQVLAELYKSEEWLSAEYSEQKRLEYLVSMRLMTPRYQEQRVQFQANRRNKISREEEFEAKKLTLDEMGSRGCKIEEWVMFVEEGYFW